MAEKVLKSGVNNSGQLVQVTATDNVNSWYTVYAGGIQRLTTHDINDAMKKYEFWMN